MYRNKRVLVPFAPRSTDQLVAEVDFGADVVTHIQGLNTVVESVSAGYVNGDLVVTAEMWGGSSNGGEFGVVGTTIEIAAAICRRNDKPFYILLFYILQFCRLLRFWDNSMQYIIDLLQAFVWYDS